MLVLLFHYLTSPSIAGAVVHDKRVRLSNYKLVFTIFNWHAVIYLCKCNEERGSQRAAAKIGYGRATVIFWRVYVRDNRLSEWRAVGGGGASRLNTLVIWGGIAVQ